MLVDRLGVHLFGFESTADVLRLAPMQGVNVVAGGWRVRELTNVLVEWVEWVEWAAAGGMLTGRDREICVQSLKEN